MSEKRKPTKELETGEWLRAFLNGIEPKYLKAPIVFCIGEKG